MIYEISRPFFNNGSVSLFHCPIFQYFFVIKLSVIENEIILTKLITEYWNSTPQISLEKLSTPQNIANEFLQLIVNNNISKLKLKTLFTPTMESYLILAPMSSL